MTQRLDSESYTKDETITIKIPFALPYWSDSENAERIDGEFVHNGQFYRLVNQELKKDTLYIVCIRDNKEKRNFDFMAGFAKLSTDVPATSKQALKLFGNILKDFIPSPYSTIVQTQPMLIIHISYFMEQFNVLGAAYPILSPPPDSIS